MEVVKEAALVSGAEGGQTTEDNQAGDPVQPPEDPSDAPVAPAEETATPAE